MKHKLYFFLQAGFVFFQCCAPPVQFSEPQPVGERNMDSFPEKLQGSYLSIADSSVLIIGDKLIVQHYHSLLRQAKNDLDSLYQLVNDSTIENRDTHESTRVVLTGDTLSGYADTYDTVFNLSEKNVLRKFKGYYFLNLAYSEGWEVKMLDLKNNHLTIGIIPSKEGLEKLKEISASAVDSASGNVQLSKDEFKEFLKEGGFYSSAEFEKIK